MAWPLFFKERLIIGNPKSSIGIVTLWSSKEKIAKNLDHDQFSLCGNLYTNWGINFIIRNIYANPYIRHLIICGNDAQKTGQALMNFLDLGIEKKVTENGWQIKKSENAILEKPLPHSALEKFRRNVSYIDLRGCVDNQKISEVILKLKIPAATKPFTKPQTFPEPFLQTRQFPSEFSNIIIRQKIIADAWVEILKNILRFGQEVEAICHYQEKQKELLNLTVVTSGLPACAGGQTQASQDDNDKNKLLDIFDFSQQDLEEYYKNFFQKDRGEESYTYGERLFNYHNLDQVEIIIKKLKNFKTDRGALAILWQPEIDNFPKRDPWRTPCLVLVQCQVYDEKLFLTGYFRSNDMFGAWPQNAFALRKLQKNISDKVGVGTGELVTISNMAHIYEHDYQKAQKIVDKYGQELKCEFDKRGNFVIRAEDDVIKISHLSPDGVFLKEYQGKNSWDIIKQLLMDEVVSQISHAFDLGQELQKAEIAIKLKKAYNQDQELNI